MTKALFFAFISLTAVGTTANTDSTSSRGYRCEYSVYYGERGPYIGYCEHKSLKRARAMMLELAEEAGGIPGACVPTENVGNGCD